MCARGRVEMMGGGDEEDDGTEVLIAGSVGVVRDADGRVDADVILVASACCAAEGDAVAADDMDSCDVASLNENVCECDAGMADVDPSELDDVGEMDETGEMAVTWEGCVPRVVRERDVADGGDGWKGGACVVDVCAWDVDAMGVLVEDRIRVRS